MPLACEERVHLRRRTMKDLDYRRLIPLEPSPFLRCALVGAITTLAVYGCGGKATTNDDDDGGDGDSPKANSPTAKAEALIDLMCNAFDECRGGYYGNAQDCISEYGEYFVSSVQQLVEQGFGDCVSAVLDYQICYYENYSCYEVVDNECFSEALRAYTACEDLYYDYY